MSHVKHHYLVDAYNLLFRYGHKKRSSLEENRKALIQDINTAAQALNLDITLVFDGKGDHLPYALRSHIDALTIVYTPSHQTADEYILQEVEMSNHPSTITVVSNDTELACKSALHGAQALSLKAFIHRIEKKQLQKKQRHAVTIEPQDSAQHIARLLALFEKELRDRS